ncbi:MAG: polyprenyl diphosphate synthase, partial [Myxococcota bacterium]
MKNNASKTLHTPLPQHSKFSWWLSSAQRLLKSKHKDWLADYLWKKTKSLVKTPFYKAYTNRLLQQSQTWIKPRHVGVVLDGNRRFARSLGLGKVIDGHALGADKVKEFLYWCMDLEIPIITIWIFSIDNFQREDQEVLDLFSLIERKTYELLESPDIHQHQMQIKYIGRTKLLPESLQKAIRTAEEQTAKYKRFRLNIAIAYGGREEIADAF